jgi:hypothetical protein
MTAAKMNIIVAATNSAVAAPMSAAPLIAAAR